RPLREVLPQEPGDEGVDDVLQPAREPRDSELAEQRLIDQAHRAEELPDACGQALAQVEVVPREPDSAQVRHCLIGHAGAGAADRGRVAVRPRPAGDRAGVPAYQRVLVAALPGGAGGRLGIAADGGRRIGLVLAPRWGPGADLARRALRV